MNDIAVLGKRPGIPTKFDPLRAKSVIETLKQAVVYAHRMEKWEEGMQAAELLAEWTQDFTTWWDANVGVRQHADSKVRADLRGPVSMVEAEAETQIKHQQVARWIHRASLRLSTAALCAWTPLSRINPGLTLELVPAIGH